MDPILADKPGTRVLLLGNDALARGAVEAGCCVAATYPGTPSSEIGNTFQRIAAEAGIYFEFSINEKVAFETAAAAAIAGVRSFTFMKHVGLNVAADAFMTLAYTGVRAGMIIVSADDPECHSSQNEQDNRYFAKMSGVPMLEPSNPEEARRMMLAGYELSEKYEMPVMLRTTTRLNHVRGPVELGPIRKPAEGRVSWKKEPRRFVTVPTTARARHPVLLETLAKMADDAEDSPFTRVETPRKANRKGKKAGFITSGVPSNYVMEVLDNVEMGIEAHVLHLGMTHPVPEKRIAAFCREHEFVIIVEELEPYLEESIKAILHEQKIECAVLAKKEGHFPRAFEFNPEIVADGIISALASRGIKADRPRRKPGEWAELSQPVRPPVLCPGCPHRAAFYAVRRATRGKAAFSTDIGCYTLGMAPPHEMGDLVLCMGSSAGAAGALSKVVEEPVVAFIGDSTFFHSGVAPLINAVHNRHRFVLNIMDNSTTAMTGHQPHPGIPMDGMGQKAPAVDIADVCRGIGVEHVVTVDPLDVKATQQAFKEALSHESVSVVITKSPCVLLLERDRRRQGVKGTKYEVYQDRCRHCHLCTKSFACPAFIRDGEDHYIDVTLCLSCGVCAQICPFDAMGPVGEGEKVPAGVEEGGK